MNVAGLQRCSCHWFVHVYAYSRSGRDVARSVPTEFPWLLNQLWTANALLPSVVNVGALVRASMSHGTDDAGLPTTSAQPVTAIQHQRCRVSVVE